MNVPRVASSPPWWQWLIAYAIGWSWAFACGNYGVPLWIMVAVVVLAIVVWYWIRWRREYGYPKGHQPTKGVDWTDSVPGNPHVDILRARETMVPVTYVVDGVPTTPMTWEEVQAWRAGRYDPPPAKIRATELDYRNQDRDLRENW